MAQNPIDQHTVPKVYLKRFLPCNRNKLFALNVKPFEWKHKVKQYTPSQVCYEPDFYTIQTNDFLDRLGIEDKYYIEKQAFDYENDFLESIFDQITNPKSSIISRPKARKLVQMLLNIKRRNQAFRNIYLDEQILNRVVENQVAELRTNEEVIKEELKGTDISLDVDEIEKIFRSKLNDKGYVSDMYREDFIKKKEQKNSFNSSLIEGIIKLRFFVFKTTTTYPFITNDNPGVTIMNDDKFRNLGFNENFFAFLFPIDPLNIFMFQRLSFDSQTGAFKEIVHKKADKYFVDFVNHSALFNCNKYAFSNQLEILENLKKKKLSG